MTVGLLGKKIGMTQVFDDQGLVTAGPFHQRLVNPRHVVGAVEGARLDARRPFECNNRAGPRGAVPRAMC